MFRTLIDRWIGRYARRSEAGLESVAALQPAVAITGGSEGIGFAIARQFALEGRPVLLIARDEQRLNEAAAAIRRIATAPVVTLALDVTDADGPPRLDATAAEAGLYIDILVNNAAIGMSGDLADQDADQLQRLIDVNIAAATRLMRHVLPAMLERGRGGVLNVGSLGAYTPGPYQAAYYASKSYLVSLTEAVAFEYRGQGVRIAVVVPGPVQTAFHARMGAENAAYRRLLPAAGAEAIARSAVRGYHLGLCVIAPGILAPLGLVAMRIVPHFLLVPLIGWLLKPGAGRR